jgi:hypothetical protein
MSLLKYFSGVMFLVLMSITIVFAQERTPLSVTEAVTVKATIEAIDKTNRIITLKGPQGDLFEVKADASVKRFDELKVGDVISATYSESVAVHLRKPGEPAPDKERVIVRPQSRPGASVEDVRTTTVTVDAIDTSAQTVTVRDETGKVQTYRVRDPKRLEGVNVGDKVDIYYTVALLLKVD